MRRTNEQGTGNGAVALAALAEFARDEEGMEIVEWTLILAAVVLPLVMLAAICANAMAFYYAVTSWVVSLPF